VTTSQKDVAIDFDDGLEPAFSSITVTDAQGKAVTSGKAVVDPSNSKNMSVSLNPLTLHGLMGRCRRGRASHAGALHVHGEVIMEPLVAAQIALAAVQYVLFAMATGSLACAVIGERSGMGAPATLRGWPTGFAITLALTALAYPWLQVAVMIGSPFAEAGPAVIAVLTQSHYGVAWSVGFIGALLATLSRIADGRGLPLFAARLVAWAAGKAAASHAADAGDFSAREAMGRRSRAARLSWPRKRASKAG